MPTVCVKTLGCRLNQAETARIKAGFVQAGYRLAAKDEPADVCVIHTCTVTAAARAESARLARSARRRRPDACVILAGCAAEVEPAALRAETGADVVAGQADKFRLPELLGGTGPAPAGPAAVPLFETTRAWLKAQDGCDFRCAYCIVPAARGPARSRPAAELVAEAEQLTERGHRELVVTGANLGCYADGSTGLVDLLARLEAVTGLARLRISSIEVSTVERDVISYMETSGKLCRFLHLPLQTGSDRLLAAMGRRYTRAEYRALVRFAADRLPGAGIGTDLVTGLPGEDEAAFQDTVRLVEELPFSNLHVFPYSPRPGTRAAALPDRPAREIARERAARLTELGRRKRAAFARRFQGRAVEVLVERVDRDGCGAGWTREYLPARVSGEGRAPGQVVGGLVRAVKEIRLCVEPAQLSTSNIEH